MIEIVGGGRSGDDDGNCEGRGERNGSVGEMAINFFAIKSTPLFLFLLACTRVPLLLFNKQRNTHGSMP